MNAEEADEEDAASVDEPVSPTGPVTLVLVGAALLRMLAVIGQHAFVYTDSIDYETLDFSGGARRPWVTPLLYHLSGDDKAMRIVWQGGIGALCWSYLAIQAASLVEDRRARWGVLVSILLLSLTTTVTNWDTAMLSESLALSFTALLIGAFLRYWRDPSGRAVALVLVCWPLWLFTRQNHLVLAWLVTLAALGVVLVRWRRNKRIDRLLAVLVSGLAAISTLGIVSYAENTEILHYNLAQVIGNRVFTNADKATWFTQHGMPVPASFPLGAAVAPQDLQTDQRFEHWIETDAPRTYAKYLLTHPWYSVSGVFEDLVSDRAPFGDLTRADEVMLATPDSYGVGRQVIPDTIEDILFQPGNAGIVVFAMLVTLVLTARRWRMRGPDPRWLIPLLALLLQWPALTVVWHASTAELGRLALPSAIVIRIALLLQLALLLDAWLADRAGGSAEAGAATEPVDEG